MKKIVEVRNIKLGEGTPKICVPLIGSTNAALLAEVNYLKTLKINIVEWRIDYHEDVEHIDKMKESLALLRHQLDDLPLLVTFRSQKEGGQRNLPTADYVALNKALIATGMADLIDVELFTGNDVVKELVNFAHDHSVKVVMSNHDFQQTPSKEEIISRLCKMQDLDADLPKIAVMPHTTDDVLTLLCATNEMFTTYADRPIITMSMSGLGIISRLAGETFGSALTFGSAKAASAPGQIPAEKLADVLSLLHHIN